MEESGGRRNGRIGSSINAKDERTAWLRGLQSGSRRVQGANVGVFSRVLGACSCSVSGAAAGRTGLLRLVLARGASGVGAHRGRARLPPWGGFGSWRDGFLLAARGC
jgi:hypothetical protein